MERQASVGDQRTRRPDQLMVALRFTMAEIIVLLSVLVSNQGPGWMQAVTALLIVGGTVAAAAWARYRLSGVAMFNITVVLIAISLVVACSGVGGPTFGQWIAFAGGVVVVLVGWVAITAKCLVSAEGEQRVRHRWALLVTPLVVAITAIALWSGAPGTLRFAASKPALDDFAARAPTMPAEPIGHGSAARRVMGKDLPSSVGAYEVRGVHVAPSDQGPIITVEVSGDCGWFEFCTLTYDEVGNPSGASHLGGNWYAGSEGLD